MKSIAIGHHPQTPQGDASRGRLDNRRVQTVGSTSSSYGISKMVLGILSLLFTRASAQFTGTYYPEAAVNLGAGSEPLLFAGGGVAQLLYGNGGSLHVGNLGLLGDLEGSSVKEIDSRTPYHSKHAVNYPNGNYGLALEVPRSTFFDVEACRWDINWDPIGCTDIYTASAAGLHNVDIAGNANSTMIVFQNNGPSPQPLAYFAHLDSDFAVTIPATRVTSNAVVGTNGRDRNPSVIPLINGTYMLTLEGAHNTFTLIDWKVREEEFSDAGASLGAMTAISGRIDNSNPEGPPNLKLSNLGAFGHAESWESKSPSPTGHYVHFVANDGTNLGTYNLNTSGNIRTGIFTEINPTMVAGAWAWDAASDNKVIVELFQRSGSTVAAVPGSSFTVFGDPTNVYKSVTIVALPNEKGIVVSAEKAGFIWTRVIYFNPLTSAPTPVPTNQPTPPPTAFPTITPTPIPATTPLPTNGSGDTQGSTSSGPGAPGTEEDTSDEGFSTGSSSDHTFTMIPPQPSPTAAVAASMKKEKAEDSSLTTILVVTISAAACSAIGVMVARARRRGSSSPFRRGRNPLRGITSVMAGQARRVSPSPEKRVAGPQSPVSLVALESGAEVSAAAPANGVPTFGDLYSPQGGATNPPRAPAKDAPQRGGIYGAAPALSNAAEADIIYDAHVPFTGIAPPKGEYGNAALGDGGKQKVSVNYDVHVPLTGIAPPKGEYESAALAEGGQQRSSAYDRANTPLKV